MHSPNQVYPKNSININNSNKSSKVFVNNSNRSSCDEDILIGNLDDLNLINNSNSNNINANSGGNKHLTNANNIDSLLMHSPSPPHNLLSYVQHQNYSQQLLQLQQNQQQQQPHHQHQHHHNQQQSYQYQQQQIPHLSNIPYRKVRPEPIK